MRLAPHLISPTQRV